MSVQLATANIVFGDSFVSRPSIQRLIFISRHNFFEERVREYTSLNSLVQDGISTSSAAYIAAQGFFSQESSLSTFILGRFETPSILTPVDAVDGKTYSFEVTTASTDGSVVVEATATSEDTISTISDALVTALGSAGVTEVTASKSGDGVQLSQATAGDWFTVKSLVSLTESFPATPTASAADELSAITAENDNFYVVTTDVKDSAYVADLATDLSARFAFYAVSLAEADAYTGEATGTFKTLVENGYLNVYPIYHHEAATSYPEVATMSEAFAVVDTGITFANRTVVGVTSSLTVDGKSLTENQIANIKSNGINFYNPPRISGSVTSQRLNSAITTGVNGGGRVCSSELAFNVVGKDALTIEIEANNTDLLISQKTGRLSYTQDDLDKARAMTDKALMKFADEDGWNLIYDSADIDYPYYLSRPVPRDFSAAERKTSILDKIQFTAYLKGAIHLISIEGNLSNPE